MAITATQTTVIKGDINNNGIKDAGEIWVGDLDNDGIIDPGETVTTTVTISNTAGSDATGVSFNETLNGMTQVGVVNVSPLAINDTYSVVGNVQTTVAGAKGVLTAASGDGFHVTSSADVEFQGATFGTGAGQTQVVAQTVSNTAGSVTFAGDGSFTYTPATDF